MLQNRNGQEIAVPASEFQRMYIYAVPLWDFIETWNTKTQYWKKMENFTKNFLFSQKALFFLENIRQELLPYT